MTNNREFFATFCRRRSGLNAHDYRTAGAIDQEHEVSPLVMAVSRMGRKLLLLWHREVPTRDLPVVSIEHS